MKRVRIEVPATAGGLGAGNGCLGMALDIVTTVEVEIDATRNEVEGPKSLTAAYCAWPGENLPGARFTVGETMPACMGLGDEIALAVAGLAAAAYATETREPRPCIISLAAREADPGQAAAAVQGGIMTAFRDGDDLRAAPIANHLLMDVVLFLSEHTQPLPACAPHPGRLAYLLAALMWGRWDRLRSVMRHDSLPSSAAAILAAAEEAGAYGAAPSGPGPALVALAPYKGGDAIAAAMERRAHDVEYPGTTRITGVREVGLRVHEIKEPESPST